MDWVRSFREISTTPTADFGKGGGGGGHGGGGRGGRGGLGFSGHGGWFAFPFDEYDDTDPDDFSGETEKSGVPTFLIALLALVGVCLGFDHLSSKKSHHFEV